MTRSIFGKPRFFIDSAKFTEQYLATAQINQITGNTNQAETPALINQLDLILDEALEFAEGFDEKDIHEVRDGIADMLFTFFGFIWRAGYRHADILTPALDTSRMITRTRVQGQKTMTPATQFLGRDVTRAMGAVIGALQDLKKIEGDDRGAYQHAGRADLIKGLTATLQLAELLNVDFHTDYDEVIESNMSKFDTDETTAVAGQAKYEEIGVETYLLPYVDEAAGVTYYVIKSSKDQYDTTAKKKRYGANKYLKSIHFKEPVYNENDSVRLIVDVIHNADGFQPLLIASQQSV